MNIQPLCSVCYLFTILAGGGVTLPPARFVGTHQASLITLQKFLTHVESNQQRGHSIFENMRTNYLQVWQKLYFPKSLMSRLWKDTLVIVIMCFIYSHCSGTASVPQLQTTEWEILSAKWMKLEAELLRERAIFGPGPGVMLNQDWVQDAVEGPNRTRARIRRKVLRRSKQVEPRSFEPELMRMVVV